MASTTINGPDVTVPGTLTCGALKVSDLSAGANSIMIGSLSGATTWGRYGTIALGSGVTSIAITGQAWPFTPSLIICSLVRPAGGLYLVCAVATASVSSNGFTAELSAATNSASYVLCWIALP